MIKKLLLFILFLPAVSLAQYHISGKVVNITDKKPVANASVFLSNASVGAKTNDDGTFDITNVRGGYYQLVVSILGFETFYQSVAVNSNISLPDLQIQPKSIVLKEVTIGPNRNWDRDYALFKRQFLGNSVNAKECKILNPEVLDLKYNERSGVLTATSTDFIEIENRTLGYKIKYLLSKFTTDYSDFGQSSLYFEGSVLFEELKGKDADIKRWRQNRLNAYEGSSMQFLRSIIVNRVDAEGFTVNRLIRKLNPAYGHGSMSKYLQSIVPAPLGVNDYAKLTDKKGQYALSFDDCLNITCHKIRQNIDYNSVITFADSFIYFDNNGIIINPQGAILEGDWGNSRIAEMLPVDYEPQVK